MLRKIVGVVVGLPLGVLSVYVGHAIEHTIFPLPESVSMDDMESLAAYISTMSFSEFVLVWLAHGSGAFVSSAACTAIAGQRWYLGAGICGIMFTLSGILNLTMLPHPWWFAVVDLFLYVPLAFLACYLVGSLFSNSTKKVTADITK